MKLAAILLLLPMALAQMPDPADHQKAMERLTFMVGTWKGEGWMEMAPGQRHEFEQSEVVQMRQQGTILTVVGQGKEPGSDRIVHDAFGVISYDTATEKYSMTAWSFPGRKGTFELTPTENGFEWGMQSGPMTIRYRMRLTEDGAWHETGEMSPDGENWRKFLEFTVRRVE